MVFRGETDMPMIPPWRVGRPVRRAAACLLLASLVIRPGAAGGADPPARTKGGGAETSAAPAPTPPRARPSMNSAGRNAGASLAGEKAAVGTVTAATTVDEILAWTLPPRSDRPQDWLAGAEPLHRCGEPRWIEPCIPPPPCHPSHPPAPWDLLGVAGDPTCGPIYAGPCCPRTGSHDGGPHPTLHRLHDRLFDAFYRSK